MTGQAHDRWCAWIEAEISIAERELIEAAPHRKIEIWRRLDLLHALRGEPAAEAGPIRSWPPVRRPLAWPPAPRSLAIGGALMLGAALGWLVAAEIGAALWQAAAGLI